MSHRNVHSLIGALALCALSLAAEAQSDTRYCLTLIVTSRPNVLGENAQVNDLNDKGEVVGSRPGTGDVFDEAFVWHDGTFRELNTLLEATSAGAGAINDRSVVLGGYFDAQSERHTFLLRQDRVIPIEPAGLIVNGGVDLNNARQVLLSARESFNAPTRFFIWQRRQPVQALEPLPGSQNTTASRLNDRGVVVGTAMFASNSDAVIWENGTIMQLSRPEGSQFAFGTDIDNRGGVLGNATFPQAPAHTQPFLWREGEVTLLAPASGRAWADASDVNNRGLVIGRSFNGAQADDEVATIWRRGQPGVDLNAVITADDPLGPFVQLNKGLLVNDRGQLVAFGRDSRDPDPERFAYYLLTPQP